jgi:Tetratricopeptide repeat
MKCVGAAVSAIVWCAVAVGQPPSEDCGRLKAQLNPLLTKYNPFRTDIPHANLKTIEAELGKPSRVEPDGTTFKAFYELDGCLGTVLFDSKGQFMGTGFQTTPLIPPANSETIERLRDIEKQINTLKQQLESLEALQATLLQRGRTAAAEQALQATNTNAPIEMGFGYGSWEKAVEAYTQVLETQPDDRKALLRRGYSYYKLGRYREAHADYSHLIENDSRDGEAYKARADVHLAVGNIDQAKVDLDAAKAVGASQTSTATSGSGSSTTSRSPPGTDVHVRGYTRKDGTYVAPHTRSAPGTRRK